MEERSNKLPEARVIRARSALSALSKEVVSPLLDGDKLVRSEIFAEMIDMAVEHATAAGDNGYVNRIVGLLAGSKHEKPLVQWFCTRVGLKVTTRSGRPHLVKSESAPAASEVLSKSFPSAVAAQKAAVKATMLEARLANPKLRVIAMPAEGYVDMLDSKARLPGSFGAGKRR